MTCDEARRLLHPYADGELDLLRHVEVERHLEGCAACSEQKNRLAALQALVASPSLYERAPQALRHRVLLDVASPPALRRPPFSWRPALAAAAAVLLLGAVSAVVSYQLRGRSSGDDLLAEAAVADHIRSLQVDHLTDVASTDQHTVKPWFHGRLDYSPPVVDLADRGFPLTGGRLDYLSGRPAAAIVYRRRAHAINLFVLPEASDGDGREVAAERQGFGVRRWRASGMTFVAVSDLNAQELEEFVRLLRQRLDETPTPSG